MPFHAEAMRRAIKERNNGFVGIKWFMQQSRNNYEIGKKNIYLLKGMPSSDLVKEVFKREHIDVKIVADDAMAKQIGSRKEQIFKQIQNAKGIDGQMNCSKV
jgi:beta-phosphoglucomutase